LVAACTSAQREGAKLKFMKLTPKVQDVVQLTRLYQVFDVYPDEDSAVQSFAV
jgi:anti-sigma B factor antagonist